MISEQTIIAYITDFAGRDKIHSDTDLFGEANIRGDDFHDLLEKYSVQFHVDMSAYLWYFHADEEGQNFGSNFFKPPYKLHKRIPVTPKMLTEFANSGYWFIPYPEHVLPKRRYDLFLNLMLLLLLIGLLIYFNIL